MGLFIGIRREKKTVSGISIIDGGLSSTSSFNLFFDNGNASASSFDLIIDGGNSSS